MFPLINMGMEKSRIFRVYITFSDESDRLSLDDMMGG